MVRPIQLAKRSLDIADQMINVTYPEVGEPKLLLGVLKDTYAATMDAVGEVAKGGSFSEIMAAFDQFAKSYDIDTDFIEEMHDILRRHDESPVEFTRRGHFVICDGAYDCKVIGAEEIKRYIFKANHLVSCVGRAVL